jgi:acyl dehydratase
MARTVPGTLVPHSGRLLESGDMAVERLRSGDRSGPYDLVLDADMAAALATATLDHTPSYFDGTALPPTAIATQTYAPQMAAIFELVPEPVFAAAHGGVHGRHDLVLHRAIRPGEELHSLVEMHSARRSKDNLRVTLLHRTYDALKRLVAEQWWTTVLLGTGADETGPELPAHDGKGCDPEQAIGEEVIRIDADMVRRYAELSGDFSDHHFDVESARRSGFAGPFLHGLCTMALCARAVVATVCPDDPSRLQRLAVQFASPAYLQQDLTVRICSLGEDRVAFEATSADSVVIRNGFAELRHPT